MKHLKNFGLSLLATAAFVVSTTACAEPKLVPAQSEVVFVSKQMGVPVEGRFKKFDGTFSFDPSKPSAAKITFAVDTASATLGVPETDVELPKAIWFNALKFPQATFTSTAVKSAGPGKLEVAGKLTIKGNVVDVVVPVALAQAGATTTASGTLVIKRLVFKIGENEWADTSMVADDVQVKFKFALTGVGKL